MNLSGNFLTLKELSNDGFYASQPFTSPRYNWTLREHIKDDECFELAQLDNIICFARCCLYSCDKNAFIKDTTYNNFYDKKFPDCKEGSGYNIPADVETLDTNSYVFILGGHNNYYHWMFNWLPKILSLKKNVSKLGILFDEVKILIEQEVPDNFRKYLYELGVKPKNIIEKKHRFLKVKKALLSNFFNQHCYYEDVLNEYRLLGDKFDDNKKRKIYVNRNVLKTSRRKIYNELDFNSVIYKHNIDSLILEKLSFDHQIKVFRSAAIVTACHGAGLANLVFCSKDATLILFEYKDVSEYEELARLLGIHVLKIKTHQVRSSEAQQNRLKDFYIDIDLFDRLLAATKINVPSLI